MTRDDTPAPPQTSAPGPGPTHALPPPRGPWRLLALRLRKNRMALVGAGILLVLYTSACCAGFLSPYRHDSSLPRANLYGPMLLGGYHLEPVYIPGKNAAGRAVEVPQTVNVEGADGIFREVEVRERHWRWFDGGIRFRDRDGNFTLRPHVPALREYVSYDEYGEAHYLTGIDPYVWLPVELFVHGEPHELFSLCGFLPVRGTLHLFGVRVPTDDPQFTSEHIARVFILGSDKSGRDLFTRILYGGQISLSVGLLGIVISMSIGLVVGGISGYFGGWTDHLLMRFVELIMAIPGLYLILCLRQLFEQNLSSRESYLMIVAILALAGWASSGRVIRGMVLALKEQEYALAARALGASHARIILRHILPNTASFVIVTATLFVPYYILGEVALSFLGFGIAEPDASWGLLLKDAQNSEILTYSPWLVIPGVFIFVGVLAYNFLGDGLRDAADPRAVLGAKR